MVIWYVQGLVKCVQSEEKNVCASVAQYNSDLLKHLTVCLIVTFHKCS